MPTRVSLPLRGALSIALAAFTCTALFAASAHASVPVDLRVVDSNGDVLADRTQYTDSVKLKTDRDADCFGEGTGGSGKRVEIDGATALGAVVDGAGAGDKDLRPVSVTDAFDFGLGVCGFGDAVAPETGFWYLKQDNVASQLGGDQTVVKRNDQITWFLDPDFADAPPAELELNAPGRVTFDTPTQVRVFEFADDGTRTPAAGVEVTGASAPTGADGTTEISLAEESQTLVASRDGAIADTSEVCAGSTPGDCPKRAGTVIGGSAKADEIEGTKGPDSIDAGGGRDEIDTRDGEVDEVDCGGGRKNEVKADRDDEVARNCEKVRY